MVPFIAYLLADNQDAFRLLALPGGLAVTVVPVLVSRVLPESPRWHLRKGHPQTAADIVNRIIERGGAHVHRLTLTHSATVETRRDQLPPYWALFHHRPAGLLSAFQQCLLRHRLFSDFSSVPQGAGRPRCGRLRGLRAEFAGVLCEYPREGLHGLPNGDHRTAVDNSYALAGSLPGLLLMLMAHWAGNYPTAVIVAGAMITGFTWSGPPSPRCAFTRPQQFPRRCAAGGTFSASRVRLFAGVLAPFLMEPHTSSPTIFFGTILVVVAIGAFIPLLFGRETVGQLETVTERVPAFA